MDASVIRDRTSNNTFVDGQEDAPLLRTTDRTSPSNEDDRYSPIAFPAAENYASISPATSSFARRHRASTITSIVSASYQIVREHFNKRKFLAVVFASLFTYLTFVGLFAPELHCLETSEDGTVLSLPQPKYTGDIWTLFKTQIWPESI